MPSTVQDSDSNFGDPNGPGSIEDHWRSGSSGFCTTGWEKVDSVAVVLGPALTDVAEQLLLGGMAGGNATSGGSPSTTNNIWGGLSGNESSNELTRSLTVVPGSVSLILQAISMRFYRSRPSWFLVTPRVHNG